MAAFTAIATGVGLAVTAATTAKSFSDASKARKASAEADAAAQRYMEEAKNELSKNYYQNLAINKEPYDWAMQNLLNQGAQLTEAAKEGDPRGAGAVTGRIMAQQNEAQAGVREAMGKEMFEIDKLVSGEDARLRDIGVGITMDQAAGAQAAATFERERAQQATEQGIQGLSSFATQVAQAAPLYAKTGAARQLSRLERQAANQGMNVADLQNKLASEGTIGNVDLKKIGGNTQMGNYLQTQIDNKIKDVKAQGGGDISRSEAEKLLMADPNFSMKSTTSQFRDLLTSGYSGADIRSLRRYAQKNWWD
jgi:hypothetical protein